MRIDRISVKNFKSIRDFDTGELPNGIIGITGGNGQGKSTLLTAIAYALYGPEALATGRADAVTWGEKKAEVNLTFEIDDLPTGIHRTQDSKGTSKAELADLSSVSILAYGPAEVNRAVEDMVGIDLVGFQASVFSKQDDLLGLGSLQPARRVSTMLRLLGIDKIDDGIKTTKAREKELKGELEMMRRSIESMPSLDLEATLAAIDRLNTDKRETEIQLVELDDAFKQATAARDALQRRVEQWTDHQHKIDRLQAQLITAEQARDNAKATAAKEPIEPTPPAREVDPDEFGYRTREYSRRMTALRAARQSSICPTCKRPFDGTDEEHLNDEELDLIRMKEQIDADSRAAFDTQQYRTAVQNHVLLKTAWQDAQRSVEAADKTVRGLKDALVRLESSAPGPDPTAEYREALQYQGQVGNDFASVGHSLDLINTSLEGYQREVERYEKVKAAYEDNQKLIKELEKEVVDYSTCAKELGDFKTSMVSGIIPALSERASDFVTQITEGKYSEIAITPTYDIQYRNEQGDLKAFANLSGGEQDAFALAMRLAIADLRAERIGILVLDEIFESLDPDRQEATWQALEKMSGRYSQIFLVTHVSAFKDRAPYTISL